MGEYYNKEYYNKIKGNCAYIELVPDNIKAVMRALYNAGIPFSATYGGYRNVVTVHNDDKQRALEIANANRGVNKANQRIIGNIEYSKIKDRHFINTTPEIALQVSAILSGDSSIKFSGVLKEKSATLTVSGAKNAEMVNRIIDNVRNADILDELSQAGFERMPDNNGFVVIRNAQTGEMSGFKDMAMVRAMFNDKSNEFFHAPAYKVDKATANAEPFYISDTDGFEEIGIYTDSEGTAPTFPTEEAAGQYAESNNIPLSQSDVPVEQAEPEIVGNPIIDRNLDLIDSFEKVGNDYPDVVYYSDREEGYIWLHYDEYAAPDGALVEKIFTEEDVLAAYMARISAENEEAGRNAFISVLNEKAEKTNILVNDPAFTDSADNYINLPIRGEAMSVYAIFEGSTSDLNVDNFIEYAEKNCAAVREDKARRERESAKAAVIDSCYDKVKKALFEDEEVKKALANSTYDEASITATKRMHDIAMSVFNENPRDYVDFYIDFFGNMTTAKNIDFIEYVTKTMRGIIEERDRSAKAQEEAAPSGLVFRFGDGEHTNFTESAELREFYNSHRNISFALGSAILEYLDEKVHFERDIPELNAGWYDKTDFNISFVINGEKFDYKGRYDIGDGKGTGGGSIIDHIRVSAEHIVNSKDNFFTAEDKAEAQKTLDVFIPFLEQYSELTEEEQQIIDNYKKEHPIRNGDDLEVSEESTEETRDNSANSLENIIEKAEKSDVTVEHLSAPETTAAENKVLRNQMLLHEVMRGSGFESGKQRIFDFYNAHNAEPKFNKAFADFLKNEYGIGGHSGDDTILMQNHDGKGISLEYMENDIRRKVNYSWNEVGKAISQLISEGKYISAQTAEHTQDNSAPAQEEAAPEVHIIPLYTHSFEYARMADEVALYRASADESYACANAIDAYSSKFYNDWRYDSNSVLKALLAEYSAERIEFVVAANVANGSLDLRLSRENVAWAEKYMSALPQEYMRIGNNYLTTHKGLLNMLADTVRGYMEQQREAAKTEKVSELRQRFIKKIQSDLADFLADTRGASEYQVNMKKDIADFIIGNKNYDFSETQYDAMLVRPHLLSELYEEWRSNDIDEWDEENMITFLSDTATSITESVERNAVNPAIEQAKAYITEYLLNKFGSTDDFSNLHSVPLGYTTLGKKGEYDFQVRADLIDCKILYYLNNEVADTEEYPSLEVMNNAVLPYLDFSEFIRIGNNMIDGHEPDEVAKVLDLAHNHITFSVITIEGEKSVVSGRTYVDTEDITELDEYQDYILKTGKKFADVIVEYYDIGNDVDNESRPAEDGEARYIQEHLADVINHSGCIILETNTHSVETPEYLLEEYAQEQETVEDKAPEISGDMREISDETAILAWKSGFEVFADGERIDGYDFTNYDNVMKVSEVFQQAGATFSINADDLETFNLIDTVSAAVMDFNGDYYDIDRVVEWSEWIDGSISDSYNLVRNALAIGDFKPIDDYLDEISKYTDGEDSFKWDNAVDAMDELRKILPQYLGSDSRTAYYYFPKGISNDSLWRIRQQSSEYAISAPTAVLSDDFMNEHNIHFYKVGRDITPDFGKIGTVSEQFNVLSDRHLLEKAKTMSHEAGKPFTEFLYSDISGLTEEEFDRMESLYKADLFEIYQVKKGDEYHFKRFAGLDELKEAPNIANYDIVYTGHLSDYISASDSLNEFDSIFTAFNIDRPEDFKGHSLSVSDVLVLHGDIPYFIDSIGYKMLSADFFKSREEEAVVQETEQTNSDITRRPTFAEYRNQVQAIFEFENAHNIPEAERLTQWYDEGNVSVAKPSYIMNGKEIGISEKLIGEIYNEITSKSAEHKKERATIYTPALGDKFRDNRGEVWELVSLTGVLPWYTDQCTLESVNGGFVVTKNESYTNLLDDSNYQLISAATKAVEYTPQVGDEVEWDGDPFEVTAVNDGIVTILELNESFPTEYNFKIDDMIKRGILLSNRNTQEAPAGEIVSDNKPEYIPKIGDLIEMDDSLLKISDITGNIITFSETESLFGNTSRMTLADFLAKDFTVYDENAEDIPAEEEPAADVPVEHPKSSVSKGQINIKNLAQLKRTLTVGAELEMTVVTRPGVENQLRRVNYADTTGVYTIRPDIPDDKITLANGGKGSYLHWGKSGEWEFNGATCSRYAANAEHTPENLILSITVTSLAPEQEHKKEDVPVEQPKGATLYTYDLNDPDPSKVKLKTVVIDLSGRNEQTRAEDVPVEQAAEKGQNFVITDEKLGEFTLKERYKANIAAIRTLQAIESENRSATPEEQEILSKYTGWGALDVAFDSMKSDWRKEYAELKEILTDEEYAAARKSTMNAHYTSPTVINAIYAGLANIGFESGKVLEPAMGIGNFFGAMPENMRGSDLHGVELDSLTGRIARQLYPNADVQIKGFEKTSFENGSFDVVVGNVPFGDYKVDDKDYNKHKWLIHDYFIAKSIDKVRPGGIVAIVTSKGTMDKENDSLRKYVAQRAELLGAIRLPNTTFKQNAGTGVTPDILFFQKRERPIEINPAEVEWLNRGETEDGLPANNYFVKHPEMVLGKIVEGNKMYGTQQGNTSCEPIPGADLKQQLAEAIKHITGKYIPKARTEKKKEAAETIPAPPDSRTFSYYAVDGTVYFRDEGEDMTKVNLKGDSLKRALAMIEIRDNVRELLDLQLNNADHSFDSEIAESRELLNKRYDAFLAKYGHFDDKKNARILNGDDGYNFLTALEEKDKDGTYKKAAIFTKDTVKPNAVVSHVETAEEALILSVAERAKVDFDYMTELCGLDKETLIKELEGQIYRLPQEEEKYVTADEYLTGNIRLKLMALENAPADMDISRHKAALEAAMPPRVEAKDISARLGAHWIDPKFIERFIKEKFDPGWRSSIQVTYSKASGRWKIEGASQSDKKGYVVTHDFGTSRRHAYDILESMLNHDDLSVKDNKLDEYGLPIMDSRGNYVKVTNEAETKAVQTCVRRIENEWADWIFKDADRREALVTKYNEVFNSIRHREYDGSHLSFVGMNSEIKLKEHQRNAVARALYGGNTMLAHAVGAGKSYEMITIAMEGKRLGLHSKSLFAVPNSLTEQMGRDFKKLYPGANILVATKKDFEPKNRKKFFAKIATGEWDAVIVGHSQFDRMGLSTERANAYLREEIEKLRVQLETAVSESGQRSFSVKQIEKTIARYEKKIKESSEKISKDDYIDFEQMGFDKLFVDECHLYKNLGTATKMSNIAGISTTGSAKAAELLLKTRYLDELTGGKGIVFASGTPVSNSMTELFTMMRYLESALLHEVGIDFFDEWAADFGIVKKDYELKPESDGKYQLKERFGMFTNLPELMGLFKECADIRTADTLDIEKPISHVHDIVAELSKIQKRLVKSLSKRATKIRGGTVDPREDNMLCITNDGRKIGLDQRLMIPGCPDNPDSKVNKCIQNVFDIYTKTAENRSTQVIFCDMSTPKQPNRQDRFEVYRPKFGGEYELLRRKVGLGKEGTQSAMTKFDEIKSYVDSNADNVSDKLQNGDIAVFRVPTEDGERIESRAAIYMDGVFIENNSLELLESLGMAPIEDMPPKAFNVYDDIRDKLIEMGVPAEEIAFIHDFETAEKKQELFEKVNRGEVRVLLGSTAKCGAGANIQEKLIALHHLDAPLRPSDMEQRTGRIERQGNENPEVDIFRYVTDKSFDAYLYQILENKQKFISQIMTSKTPERVCSDVDEQALDYAEVKALCAGNPLIRREMELQALIKDIKSEKARYNENIYELQDNIRVKYPQEIQQAEIFAKHYAEDLKTAMSAPKVVDEEGKESYPLKLGDTVYNNRKEAGEALKNALSVNMAKMAEGKEITIGEYRGLKLSILYNEFLKKTQACLKGEKAHYCELNITTDIGNITRLDNLINNIQKNIDDLNAKAETKKAELEKMKADVEKPFPREEELRTLIDELEDVHVKLTQFELTDDTAQKDLFERCVDMFPEVMAGEKSLVKYEAGGGYTPLSVEMNEDILTVMRVNASEDGVTVGCLRFDFKVDYENQKVIPVRYDDTDLSRHKAFDVEGEITPEVMKEINDALSTADDWFDEIESEGYMPVSGDDPQEQSIDDRSI